VNEARSLLMAPESPTETRPVSEIPPSGVLPRRVEGSLARSDEARLRSMVDSYLDFTWRSLRRLGLSPDAADDAAQRVFVVAHERLADIQPGCEKAFLFKTAVRVASTARRTYARRREVLTGEETFESHDPAPRADELLDRQRARALLEELLDDMEMDLRVVFVLFELEGQKMSEIAVTLDVPEGTVASRLRRARAEFQSMVKRYQARGPGGAR
jgi:RNA polymerase sigma-70 factor (ECF subfamily)